MVKQWEDYTRAEQNQIRVESKARGVSELFIVAERNSLYNIEFAKELAIAELKLVKAELEAAP